MLTVHASEIGPPQWKFVSDERGERGIYDFTFRGVTIRIAEPKDGTFFIAGHHDELWRRWILEGYGFLLAFISELGVEADATTDAG